MLADGKKIKDTSLGNFWAKVQHTHVGWVVGTKATMCHIREKLVSDGSVKGRFSKMKRVTTSSTSRRIEDERACFERSRNHV